jgi:hypothetical protein
MNANTKANAELELRPLDDQELEVVSGGLTASPVADWLGTLLGYGHQPTHSPHHLYPPTEIYTRPQQHR